MADESVAARSWRTMYYEAADENTRLKAELTMYKADPSLIDDVMRRWMERCNALQIELDRLRMLTGAATDENQLRKVTFRSREALAKIHDLLVAKCDPAGGWDEDALEEAVAEVLYVLHEEGFGRVDSKPDWYFAL